MKRHLRTLDLADESGLSVQQVRNYEALGFLPPPPRSRGGHRLYDGSHLDALITARTLIRGYGFQQALAVMRRVHAGRVDDALALADARHAALDARRGRAGETLEALRALQPELRRHPKSPYARPGRGRGLRIGEAARVAGVRTSAVRHWESLGLLQPERDRASRYRLYQGDQLTRLRVVALLRGEGYRFDTIRLALEGIGATAGGSHRAVEAVEGQQGQIAAASRATAAATAALWSYLVRQSLVPAEP